jgi:hypothetical protein
VQEAPAGQARPQNSQFSGSEAVSTQVPEQQTPSPPASASQQELSFAASEQLMDGSQTPVWQAVPSGQTSPQLPQFEESKSRSTHAPLQHSVKTCS